MSFFSSLLLLPEDPILSIPKMVDKDPRTKKINLSVGAYRTSEGKPLVLSSVLKAEAHILENFKDKEYLPIEGNQTFLQPSKQLIYGDSVSTPENLCILQALGGSGALRIGAEFLAREGSNKTIYLPNPTWPNHKLVFKMAGLKIENYPYFDPSTHGLDFTHMCQAIKEMPERSIILLHACCHNPTGIDPTFEQWKEIAELIKIRSLIPFFDFAYQGFGEDPDSDAEIVRYFASQNHEMFVACSNSKNFGLYGERVGTLSILTHEPELTERIYSHLKQIIRGNYSNPPMHGELIVGTILSNPELKKEWLQELANMRDRIKAMRKALAAGLVVKTTKDFNFINQQKGIFSYSGLMQDQVLRLRQDYGIYMPLDGRINVAGLNYHNLDSVIEAILSVL